MSRISVKLRNPRVWRSKGKLRGRCIESDISLHGEYAGYFGGRFIEDKRGRRTFIFRGIVMGGSEIPSDAQYLIVNLGSVLTGEAMEEDRHPMAVSDEELLEIDEEI